MPPDTANRENPQQRTSALRRFIDDSIAFRNEQDGNLDLTARIFGGLIWLDRQATLGTIVSLSADDHPSVPFFGKLRSLTVSGYFRAKSVSSICLMWGNIGLTLNAKRATRLLHAELFFQTKIARLGCITH